MAVFSLGTSLAGSATAAAAPSAKSTVTLSAPPTIATPSAPFVVRLGVPGSSARSQLSLRVTVYSALHNPSEFAETLDGSPVGTVLARSGAIALSSLSPDSADPQHGVDLSVPVTAGGVAGAGSGPFTANLECDLGSCGGVYPVRIELSDAKAGAVTSHLLTYLVYTDPPADIEPLRFALVVPVDLVGNAPGTPPLGASALERLTGTLNALSGPRAAVPVTIAPTPRTVAALNSERQSRARQALSTLVALTDGQDRQTLCGPFVPVDAGALVKAGLSGELTEQVHRGSQVLGAIPGTRTSSCSSDNAWVATSTLDTPSLTALAALGYNHVVVPPASVSGPSLSTTPTRRFTLGSPQNAGNAMLSDPTLSAHLEPSSRLNPATAADQFLAALELDYYEAPNTSDARGVVAVPAGNGDADPTVVADVLDGLESNPMVKAVTLATMFSEIPVGGAVGRVTQPSTRRPAAINKATGLPTRAIKAARDQWTRFAASVSISSLGNAVAASLDDLLLESEAQALSPTQRRTGVARFQRALDQQLASLSVTSPDVRLTARTGSVPITVIKNAPYPIQAVLTVTSDKIVFSAGKTQTNSQCETPVVTNSGGKSSVSSLCRFVHGTNAVYVEMRSRVSGDFRMAVTLNSPQGGLILAGGQLTVRSMSTSTVAIGLSAAAGAVLLGWWGRTTWRTRRSRRGAHRRGAAASRA